jgi:hypothetical protein
MADFYPRQSTRYVDCDVTEVSAPLHPKNRTLCTYWSSKADGAGQVHRRDIDPAELKHVLGGIFIVEPVDGGADLLYRLVGAENEHRLGMKCMGRRFTECYAPDMAAKQIAFHGRVFATGQPAVLQGRLLGLDLEYVNFEAIYLPVHAEHGGRQMLGGMYDLAET